MRRIHHINMKNDAGHIYCCLRNKVVKLDAEQHNGFCSGCSMFAGNAGGLGVECVWNDWRPVNNPYTVTDPKAEWASNQSKTIGSAEFHAKSSELRK